MRAARVLGVIAFLLSPFCVSITDAVVLDFEALRHDTEDISVIQEEYIEDGYRFLARHPIPGNQNIFATLGTLQPGFPGSTALYRASAQGEIILTRADGGVFTLLSIRLAELPNLTQDLGTNRSRTI
jgi:hypothetical protein